MAAVKGDEAREKEIKEKREREVLKLEGKKNGRKEKKVSKGLIRNGRKVKEGSKKRKISRRKLNKWDRREGKRKMRKKGKQGKLRGNIESCRCGR